MKKFKHTNEELDQAKIEAEGVNSTRQGQKKSKYGESIIEF